MLLAALPSCTLDGMTSPMQTSDNRSARVEASGVLRGRSLGDVETAFIDSGKL
jgi:hypothetical protein